MATSEQKFKRLTKEITGGEYNSHIGYDLVKPTSRRDVLNRLGWYEDLFGDESPDDLSRELDSLRSFKHDVNYVAELISDILDRGED